MSAADEVDVQLQNDDADGDETLAQDLVRRIVRLEGRVQTEKAAIRQDFEQTTATAQTQHQESVAASERTHEAKTQQLRRTLDETRRRAEDVVAQTRSACDSLRLRPPTVLPEVPPGLDPRQELARIEAAVRAAQDVVRDRRQRMGKIGCWWGLLPVALVYWIVLMWETRQQHKVISQFAGMAQALSEAWQAQVAATCRQEQAAADARSQRELTEARERFDRDTRAARERQESRLTRLRSETRPVLQDLRRLAVELASSCENAAFTSASWQRWQPSSDGRIRPLRIGSCLIATPAIQSLLPGEEPFAVPVLLQFRGGKSLMIKQGGVRREANELVQSLAMRLLATLPAGRVRFVAIDPIAQGNNVSTLINLGDYQEDLVDKRAWSDPRQIEDALSGISSAMEEIIQKHLRDKHPTIESFNLQAEEVAQPYRLVLVFDFPHGFNDVAARRLLSIMRNGPRCGVYCLVTVDEQAAVPYGFRMTDLEDHAYIVSATGQEAALPASLAAEPERVDFAEPEEETEEELDFDAEPVDISLEPLGSPAARPPADDDEDFEITFVES